MDLDNILQTLLSQKREFENENGYSEMCIENSRENGDGPEIPKDPTNLLHAMDNNIDTKQDFNIRDEDIIHLEEFKDMLGVFNDNTMLTDEDLPSNDVNIEHNVDSSIESKALFDLDPNTVLVDSNFQKQVVTVVEQVTNIDLLSKDNVFIDIDGKIEIEIDTSTKDHGVNAKTHQSNMNSSIGTKLPSFQEAFRIFCDASFNAQNKAHKHSVQYKNEDKSQKDKKNELRITSIDATDDSGDGITLVEDQTEYYDSILTQHLKLIDYYRSDDITGIAMVQLEAANTTEYDSDCDGYHSSDFEFITESEAESCGIIVNSNKLTQRTRKNKARTLNDSQNKLVGAQDSVFNDDMLHTHSQTNESNETAHKIPEGEDFFNLFLGHNVPIVPMHYMMENKSVGVRSCMAVDNEGIGFNMGATWRDDNVDDELKKDAERTVRKILNLYPSENYKRQRRH